MLTPKRLPLPHLTGEWKDDGPRVLKAISDYFLSLEAPDSLTINEAELDSSPIGSRSASSGKFTTLEVTTSSVFPSGAVTPGLTFGGGSTGLNADKQVGSYIKVGGYVIGNAWLRLTAKGSSVGVALLTGLPFAARNNDDTYAAVSFYAPQVKYTGQLQGYVNKNTSTIVIEQVTEAGVRSQLTDVEFANNSELVVSFIYRAT